MKIKICGLKYLENIKSVVDLQPDFTGFIFYKQSKRYVGSDFDLSGLSFPDSLNKTGVFVNESLDKVIGLIEKYKLQYVQLHGEESIEYCVELKKQSAVGIIKVFLIQNIDDLEQVEKYSEVSDYFLFDTKTDLLGGSGKKFDWNILSKKNFSKPVLLSGGIGIDDIPEIKNLVRKGINIAGVDVNSRLEISPGLKDISAVKQIISLVRND